MCSTYIRISLHKNYEGVAVTQSLLQRYFHLKPKDWTSSNFSAKIIQYYLLINARKVIFNIVYIFDKCSIYDNIDDEIKISKYESLK